MIVSAGEWYYDRSRQQLHYKPANFTDRNASDLLASKFVATHSQVLFNVSGSQAQPVRGVSFRGLHFADIR